MPDPGLLTAVDRGNSLTAAAAQRRAYVLAMVAVLCWSTVATAFKLALRSLDVTQLLLYANATAALFLLAYVLLSRRSATLWQLARQDWARCLGLGMLNPLAFYLVLLAAYDQLPAQVAQPLNYTWAITLSLLAVPLLGQRITSRDWFATAVAYSGVVVISRYTGPPGHGEVTAIGISLALASTVLWALYWIYNMRASGDASCRLALNFLFALPVSLLVCALFSDPLAVDRSGLAAAVWVGVLEMGLPFITWRLALSLSANTSRVSNLVFLSPFLSLQLINWVLDEPIQASTYAGLLLIVAGLLIQRR